MRISISNIAWDIPEDEAVARLLQRHGVDAIDIAPGKYFPDPAAATDDGIAKVKTWWRDRGIDIVGMQALLFGTTGMNVFASEDVQARLLDHLRGVCRIGAGLGAVRLVFGSPKNRDRGTLDDASVQREARRFFRRLGDIAASHGVIFCLEPNPACYGANFMTTTPETAEVVADIDHPAIRMQLDTGALTINQEVPVAMVQRYHGLVGHVHASEPQLVPLGDAGTDHALIARALREHLSGHIVTIEMVATRAEPHLESVERAVRTAVSAYGDVEEQGA
jgi:sugar phosphate isomerase/epimerase